MHHRRGLRAGSEWMWMLACVCVGMCVCGQDSRAEKQRLEEREGCPLCPLLTSSLTRHLGAKKRRYRDGAAVVNSPYVLHPLHDRQSAQDGELNPTACEWEIFGGSKVQHARVTNDLMCPLHPRPGQSDFIGDQAPVARVPCLSSSVESGNPGSLAPHPQSLKTAIRGKTGDGECVTNLKGRADVSKTASSNVALRLA